MRAAVSLSLRFSIPKIVIGMTVVSFATSAPELIVSVQSALSGHPDLALGNVVGSNIANIGFVLAITIIISPINVTSSFYKIDWPMMIFSSLLFYFFLVEDNQLVAYEGAILFVSLLLFLIYLIKFQKEAALDEAPEDEEALKISKTLTYLLIGGFSLWLGSETLIKGAVNLAQNLGVSERIISVSIVSVGTSIPELSASIIAIINKEKAISLGNLIGSNIFNILAVMGITAMIHPVEVQDTGLLSNDIWWMFGISLIILPLVFFPKGLRLSWSDGLVLISLYLIFILPLFAFLNAGVPLLKYSLTFVLSSPIFSAIAMGLVIGKPLGIYLFVALAKYFGFVELPEDVTSRHLIGVGFLCGIGFTMSLFIASLAFDGFGELYDIASRMGILVGSFLSAALGSFILYMCSRRTVVVNA